MRPSSIHPKKENGQAIVLVAITMVIMLAFTGLAIDGGGSFLLYRDLQNATDSAALSAAFALCSGGDPESAALRSASINGFNDPANPAPRGVNADLPPAGTTTGTAVTVLVENPPTLAGYTTDNYVRVRITSTKPSYFIQVVYDGPLVISAETISECQQPGNFGWPDNAAVITLSRTCTASGGNQPPFRNTGNSTFQVISGSIYVNGGGTCDSTDARGASSIVVEDGICAQGVITGNVSSPSGTLDSNCTDVDQITNPDPLAAFLPDPIAYCNGLTARGSLPTTNPVEPGLYTGSWQPSGYTYLNPGVYCVLGENDIRISGTLESDQTQGVTIITNAQRFRGNSMNLRLYSTRDSDSPFTNMLLWNFDTNTSNQGLQFRGQADMVMEGTIYAPYKHCDMAGGAGSAILNAQLICYSIDGTGGSDQLISFTPGRIFEIPPSFGVTE